MKEGKETKEKFQVLENTLRMYIITDRYHLLNTYFVPGTGKKIINLCRYNQNCPKIKSTQGFSDSPKCKRKIKSRSKKTQHASIRSSLRQKALENGTIQAQKGG